MPRNDAIFWSAAALVVLALGLFAVTKNQFWLALMIASYLLRPTLASLGLARRNVDERQLSLHDRSGSIGFAVTIAACVVFMIKLGAADNHAFELFAAAIVLGLAAKGLFNVIMVEDKRPAAAKIIVSVGLLVAVFASLDAGSFGGVLVSVLPGLAIAGVGLLLKRFPRLAGIVILVATALLLAVILRRVTWGQIVTAVLIGVPLIVAGVYLLVHDARVADGDPTTADPTGPSTAV